jgi:hypothetical protein
MSRHCKPSPSVATANAANRRLACSSNCIRPDIETAALMSGTMRLVEAFYARICNSRQLRSVIDAVEKLGQRALGHAPVFDRHAFAPQQLGLLAVFGGRLREDNTATGTDNAVPGKIIDHHSQSVARQPRTARVSSGSGHIAIGRRSSSWDR